jgi:aminoglycoside phosphotransferase (APT) family kinase protein
LLSATWCLYQSTVDATRLTEYLKPKMPNASDLRVIDLVRIPGGSSRETYSFELEWRENGARKTRPMIARRDPTGGLLKSEREREYKVVAAMHRAGMKIPEPLFLELDPAVMERPFFIMHRLPGRTAAGAMAASEPEPLRRRLANEFLTEMARLHKLDWRALGMEFLGVPNDLAAPARAQTQHWFDLYHADRMNEPWPIIDAAFAWLKANPVVADRIAIVHGDFRAGNYLFDENGLISMLDWEMTHLGDPLEDLGWSSMRLWGHQNLAGGLIDTEEYIKLYEQKSGAPVDRKRLFFYQVLGNAKMAVICLTGIRDFAEGRTSDPTMISLLSIVLPILLEDLAAMLKLV